MRILACGAHPDDVEIACGATVAQAVARGPEVHILDLTRGEMGSNGSPELRAEEAGEAARILGVVGRRQAGLPDGGLRSEDAAQGLILAGIIRELRPELIILPAPENRHPDHDAAHRLLKDASFRAGLARLDVSGEPWRPRLLIACMERRPFRPDFILPADEGFEAKHRSLAAYRSQFARGDGRSDTLINDPDFLDWIRARDRYYGGLASCRCGEPFLVLGPVVVDDLAMLAGRVSP